MRILRTLVVSSLLASTASSAPVTITDVSTDVSTAADRPQIWIEFTTAAVIDPDASSSRFVSDGIVVFFVDDELDSHEMVPVFNDDWISFQVADPTSDLAKRIAAGDSPYFIRLSDTMTVVFDDATTGELSPEAVKELSAKITLSADHIAALEDVASGRQRIYEDKLDFAREVDEEDSTRADYAVSFELTQPIGRTPLSIETSGRLSTHEESPLNQIAVSLVGRTGVSRVSGVFYSAHVDAGIVTTQGFDTGAGTLSAGVDLLLPNFIDLTGGANRLRLKPVVGASLGYKRLTEEVDVFGDERGFLEARFELAYTIPILDTYVLDVRSHAVFNDDAVGDDDWFHLTSATLSYALPGNEVSILAKWERGRNEFSSAYDTEVLLGLLADFLPM